MAGFDEVWHRIVALRGETFRQRRGKPFTYAVSGNSLKPSTTNRQLPRSHFARPLSGHRWTGLASFRTCRDRLTSLLS
jgi:hypothetical protein